MEQLEKIKSAFEGSSDHIRKYIYEAMWVLWLKRKSENLELDLAILFLLQRQNPNPENDQWTITDIQKKLKHGYSNIHRTIYGSLEVNELVKIERPPKKGNRVFVILTNLGVMFLNEANFMCKKMVRDSYQTYFKREGEKK